MKVCDDAILSRWVGDWEGDGRHDHGDWDFYKSSKE